MFNMFLYSHYLLCLRLTHYSMHPFISSTVCQINSIEGKQIKRRYHYCFQPPSGNTPGIFRDYLQVGIFVRLILFNLHNFYPHWFHVLDHQIIYRLIRLQKDNKENISKWLTKLRKRIRFAGCLLNQACKWHDLLSSFNDFCKFE